MGDLEKIKGALGIKRVVCVYSDEDRDGFENYRACDGIPKQPGQSYKVNG